MITNQHPEEQTPVSVLSEQEIQEMKARRAERVPDALKKAFFVNPVVHSALTPYLNGEQTYEGALEAAVVALVEVNARRSTELRQQLTMERTLSSHHLGPTGAPES